MNIAAPIHQAKGREAQRMLLPSATFHIVIHRAWIRQKAGGVRCLRSSQTHKPKLYTNRFISYASIVQPAPPKKSCQVYTAYQRKFSLEITEAVFSLSGSAKL